MRKLHFLSAKFTTFARQNMVSGSKESYFFFTITKLIWELRNDGINSCRMRL